MVLPSTPRRNFHSQLVDELGRDIATGVVAPGFQLETEQDLAARMGVGRLAVREAMKALAAKGMVSIRTRVGTRVLPSDHWNPFDPQVLAWQSEHSDPAFVNELVELRRMVEPSAARLAARRASVAELRAIRAAYETMVVAADGTGDYTEADLRFHCSILRASHNRFIIQMQGPLSKLLTASFTASTLPDDDHFGLAMHGAILKALESRDPAGAAQAFEALIDCASLKLEADRLRKTTGDARLGAATDAAAVDRPNSGSTRPPRSRR